ncbi:VOC family protein [Polymorphospora rubra]|uniref:VOC family protein n=1 Tax=Polymorphospora rubra TaxID=338584 RepID=UPI003411C989
MGITTTAHLNFRGNARQALEFYQSVFGGRLTVVTYGDFGMPNGLPDTDKVVWGQVEADNGFHLMAYDVPSQAEVTTGTAAASTTWRENGMTLTGQPYFMSIRGESVEEVGALWGRLVDGATVVEAYATTQWAPAFGMLTDRFGVTWILDVAARHTAA